MECIGKVECRSDGHVFVEDNDGNELSALEHVGQSLYVGDYDALLKELRELRKDKERKQYLIDLFGRVTTLGDLSDAAIDAAIAKSQTTLK